MDAVAQLAARVGQTEARRFAALVEAFASVPAPFDLELLSLDEARELEGGLFRPGLVPFARDSVGSVAVWDVRFGRPTNVLWCEEGLATPLAPDVRSAMVRLLLRDLAAREVPPADPKVVAWRDGLGPALGPRGHAALRRLVAERRTVTPSVERALGRPFAVAGRAFDAYLPPAVAAVLDPNDPGMVRDACGDQGRTVRFYRALVRDEERPAYRWHLAAAARAHAHLLHQLGQPRVAVSPARLAARLYEELLEEGELRVRPTLAFVHHLLAELTSRHAPNVAWKHAQRALALREEVAMESEWLLDASASALTAWLMLLGDDPDLADEARSRLRNAHATASGLAIADRPGVGQSIAARIGMIAAELGAGPDRERAAAREAALAAFEAVVRGDERHTAGVWLERILAALKAKRA